MRMLFLSLGVYLAIGALVIASALTYARMYAPGDGQFKQMLNDVARFELSMVLAVLFAIVVWPAAIISAISRNTMFQQRDAYFSLQ